MPLSSPATLAGLLRDPDYVRVWLTGACSGVSRWLETLVAGVFAFEATGSPFLVALLMVVRLVPVALFGSLVGTLADRIAPRLVLLTGFSLTLAVSCVVVTLLAVGVREYWVVVVASVASGVLWTTDMPIRRRIAGDIAGRDRLVAALSFDSATNHGMRMLGPFAGGLIYQSLGIVGAFAVTMCLYATAVAMISRLGAGGAPGHGGGPATRILSDLVEGIAVAMRDADILRILLVTLVFNIWGLPFLAMIPVIGSEELGLSAAWIGGLAALEGAGAFLGTLTIAIVAPTNNLRRLYYFGALGYVILAYVAGWMGHAVAMAVVLFCIGLSLSGFSSMQSALIYTGAPPHMRSRVFGLLVICIGAGLVGVANMGLMGEWFGGAAAVRIVALEGAVALVAIGLGWRRLRKAPG